MNTGIIGETGRVRTVYFNTSEEATKILDHMRYLCETYGLVRVADYYDLIGSYGSYTDNCYGWTDLSSVKVRVEPFYEHYNSNQAPDYKTKYILTLPMPVWL